MLKCTRPHARMRRTSSIARSTRLALLLLGIAAAAPGAAGGQGTISRNTDLFAAPGQRPLATLRQGAAVTTGAAQGGWTQVTVDGWVAALFLGAARDSFAVTVKPGNPVRLRADAAPKSAIVGDLRAGMGLEQVERRGAWAHVRRTGWVASASIAAVAPVAASATPASAGPQTQPQPAAAGQPGAPDAAAASVQRAPAAPDTTRVGLLLTPVAPTALAASPDGERVGTLQPGARATVTGRDRGWIRIQVEGWAREADFSIADTTLRGAVSAADLRADPEGTVGRLVHWDVEVLAHQVADPLRKGLGNREPYLLAQGPAGENALLYLAIPPSLAAVAAQIPDLARATITARVRIGRSEPVGVPVLELLTIVQR